MIILKQIKEHEVFNVIKHTHNQDDFIEGDISDRIEDYPYYNHILDYPIKFLKSDDFFIDQDIVNDIKEVIKNEGIHVIPKITIDEKGTVIDGGHRLKAFEQLGLQKIDLLKGTKEKFEPNFEKKLIDKDLKIYKITLKDNNIEYGSISIMEDAKFSPCQNSVFEFLVNEKYQNLGIGTTLLKEAKRQYPELGAQVSSVASLKSFVSVGFLPNKISNNNFFFNPTDYDFKTLSKVFRNKENTPPMYKNDFKTFNEVFENCIKLFEDNGGSLFLKKIDTPKLKHLNKMKI